MDYLKKQIDEIDKKIDEAKKLLSDQAMKELAQKEIEELSTQRAGLEKSLQPSQDSPETKAVIMEIRAAAGGDEAGLFASDLYRMYVRYGENKGWKVEVLSETSGGIGNIKEVSFRIKGSDAYQMLKHESGVHRVQRVPSTESGGRIHTSTATVAVLPEISEKELSIEPKDLKIETYRSSGAGGQSVQKVETAVRIIHLPTNLVVTCQSERSQFQNKERAMTVLRSRLHEAQRQAEKEGVDVSRKLQVGTGDRSEKIRTYNFPQDRITDHRIGKSWHNIEKILEGELDTLLQNLANSDLA